MIFAGKNIIVGITGGIAAYKSPELVRRLRQQGADVRVVMTKGAGEFITALTLQAVSGHAVHENLLDATAEAGMGHIELAKWAEHIVIAPATADFIAKMAHGAADDLLSTLLLASRAKVHIAPAMNQQMWQHASVKRNIAQLQQDGINIIGPAAGQQACGDIGYGRMFEVASIMDAMQIESLASEEKSLQGKHVLLTAGPTWEAIDPVRGLTNRSSGKMGYALATAAHAMGAQVTLISGPVCLPAPEGVDMVYVESALQMHDAVMQTLQAQNTHVDVFIAVAAVADYRAEHVQRNKIKKGSDILSIELIRNPDILQDVAAHSNRPFCVGFAAETDNLIEYAKTKLQHKNIDVIFANLVGGDEVVFGSQDNAVTLITKTRQMDFPRQPKLLLAKRMLTEIARLAEF